MRTAIVLLAVACSFFVAVVGALTLNCPALPPHTPKDIYDLKPNNIKVVMALGDSITAGFGIMGLEGDINEWRGQSWCIGGDPNATTVPNFLSTYVPDLQGAAKGHHILEFCGGPKCPDFQYHPNIDVFNAAQSGAMIMNLPLHETDYLINQVYNNKKIDIMNDWKLLTIFIGANDICSCCSLNASYTGPDAFEKYLTDTLERVRMMLPRTFVNLVQAFNFSEVYNISRKSLYCAAHQSVDAIECPCIFQKNGSDIRLQVDIVVQEYNKRLVKIANSYAAKKYTDFAAVVQPFLADTHIADFPVDFLSTLDCFHPSLHAHQTIAIALWNSMLTPIASKPRVTSMSSVPICPTAEHFIYAV